MPVRQGASGGSGIARLRRSLALRGGHDLLDLRTGWDIDPHWQVFARIYNLADKRTADSAHVSSNTAVYSPGLPRTYYAGMEARW